MISGIISVKLPSAQWLRGLIDDKSQLLYVMAWCCQATGLYMSSCWGGCVTPYACHESCTGDHYNDDIMSTMASQITSLTIVYSTVYSGIDHKKHQSSASLAFVRGIHRWPVNSPHKGPVMRKRFPFDNIIMLAVTGKQRKSYFWCEPTIYCKLPKIIAVRIISNIYMQLGLSHIYIYI